MSMNTSSKTEILPDSVHRRLDAFQTISLAEAQMAHMQSRFDKKYLFPLEQLPHLLQKLPRDFRLLAIEGECLCTYENLYFDTPELTSYYDHHNDRARRYKIRIRRYGSTGHCFLEIKRKHRAQQTRKERIPVPDLHHTLSREELFFLRQKGIADTERLRAQLQTCFRRLTLVDMGHRERVTLDLGLAYENDQRCCQLSNLVIAEVKQETPMSHSLFHHICLEQRIFPVSFSKYCIGIVLCHGPVRYNRFKPKILLLNKLNHVSVECVTTSICGVAGSN